MPLLAKSPARGWDRYSSSGKAEAVQRFFEMFSYHHALGWLTSYENRLPRIYCGGALRRLLEGQRYYIAGRKQEYTSVPWFNKVLPKRAEGYDFWARETGADFHRSWLWSIRPHATTVRRVQRSIARILWWQGKQRFTSKFTGPGRVGFLKSLFPNARFIHLVREPEAQIRSILKVGFWKDGGGNERLFWHNDVPPFLQNYLDAAQATGDPVALAASQWRGIVEAIRYEARMHLAVGDYHEVRYEDFMAQPRETVAGLWHALGLEADDAGLERIANYPLLSSRNRALRDKLTSSDRETIQDWVSRTLPDN